MSSDPKTLQNCSAQVNIFHLSTSFRFWFNIFHLSTSFKHLSTSQACAFSLGMPQVLRGHRSAVLHRFGLDRVAEKMEQTRRTFANIHFSISTCTKRPPNIVQMIYRISFSLTASEGTLRSQESEYFGSLTRAFKAPSVHIKYINTIQYISHIYTYLSSICSAPSWQLWTFVAFQCNITFFDILRICSDLHTGHQSFEGSNKTQNVGICRN